MDAEVLLGETSHPMRKLRAEGFFVASLERDPEHYLLRMTLWNGTRAEIEDPYRFAPMISDFDLHIHGEGTQYESYHTMGAHPVECEDVAGVRFAVWAPNAEVVSVMGDFNDWDERRHPMRSRSACGSCSFRASATGTNYKYSVRAPVAATGSRSPIRTDSPAKFRPRSRP